MSKYSSLIEKIRLRTASVAVLGLGHVGLPTSLIFARAGFSVTGIDTDLGKVKELNEGICHIEEPGLQDLLTGCLKDRTFQAADGTSDRIRASDCVIICVPTPVINGVPNMTSFRGAFDIVKASVHDGLLILIESTIPPSTMSKYAVPQLQALGYSIDKGIFVAYCPERLAPGHALDDFVNNTRIVGGAGPNSTILASELLKTVCREVAATDALTAELAKVAENTFRDLNIAYANLLALIAENLGGDVGEVIRLANTHPRVTIHKPGLGVGGPCLPKDPYLLINDAPEDVGQLIRIERRLNEQMPRHAFNLLVQVMKDKGVEVDGAKIAVLGVAYKADTEDVTNSPAEPIIRQFLRARASVFTYDPYASDTFGAIATESVDEALRDADCVVVVTAHSAFKSIDPTLIRRLSKKDCVIFDGPRLFDHLRIEKLGLKYLATGYGVPHDQFDSPSSRSSSFG